MDSFLTSTSVVALAEIGDKTQLLAIVLTAKFNRPVPVILGILFATIANHFLAALAGANIAALLASDWFRYAVAISFVAMGAWTLVPDKIEDEGAVATGQGAFLTTLVAFFLVEIGDKTQIATIALAARYQEVLAVTAGTTLGMLIANVPAVLLGNRILQRLPMASIRIGAAALFIAIGIWIALETAGAV